ncbi:glutathione S-transferase [Sinimarinibacterium sp. CAU 1509]|uniref:glutathione S-transferase N-terminal domain-containing protein n=1 Tax=Sinimarinibacterium sp. CAU 1509 TaxID=2562283 RepID=UPI0010ACDBA3|nr:glutathione S-transferase N-terminal domain-containing protein [Sinimarinibacterium sp. CAU 1509]TJY65226.1 glutathione S-transferase [Sinimarinibacterium sp. CAU 1509]
MQHALNVASSVLTSTAALWRGTDAFRPARKQPEQPLALYEFEGCPYCRMLRSALTELDLDVMIYPCPKNGTRFRPKVATLGGKTQFPFLHDPNTGARLYESADIAEYLARTYDGKLRAERALPHSLSLLGSMTASATRPHAGMRARPSRAPEQPLELYSFESSPYSRLVREKLCELELPYLLHNTGKARWSDMGPPQMRDRLFKGPKDGSRNRRALLERTGRVQVPYLIDPNTGSEMYESAAIIDYLQRTYAL